MNDIKQKLTNACEVAKTIDRLDGGGYKINMVGGNSIQIKWVVNMHAVCLEIVINDRIWCSGLPTDDDLEKVYRMVTDSYYDKKDYIHEVERNKIKEVWESL